MDSIQKAFLLILSVTIFSVVFIEKNKVKKNRDQVLVFFVVLLIHVLCFSLWKKMYCDKKKDREVRLEEAKMQQELQQKLQQEMEDRAKETKKLEFTSDRIIPIKSYNPRDCTNDGSCIIPGDKANLYGLHKKESVNPFTKYNSKEDSGLSPCVRCNRPLTLFNNPPTEDFLPTCSCNFCEREIKEIDLNNKMCIYCKTAYLQSNQCFNPSKIPNAMFLEK